MPNNSIDYSSILRRRFEFGIPLEDIFPENDIHQILKFLFSATINVKLMSKMKMEDILREEKTNVKESLKLKEQLVDNQSVPVSYCPLTYCWIIRHFLGLLPVPLLSKYYQGIRLEWDKVSLECQDFIENSKNVNLKSLNFIISEQISLIPFANFLLLHVLLSFMRTVCTDETNHVSSRSAYAVAKYFGPAIFLRPYQPSHETATNKQHVYFLFYLIYRWHRIKNKCVHKNVLHTNQTGTFKNIDFSRAKNFNYFKMEIIPIYKYIHQYSNSDDYLLRSIGCQTDNKIIVPTASSLKSGTCCCTYGSHYEKEAGDQQNLPVEDKSASESNENEHLSYGWISEVRNKVVSQRSQQYVNKNYKTSTDNLNSTSIEIKSGSEESVKNQDKTDNTIPKGEEKLVGDETDYMYDDYDTFKREEFNQIQNSIIMEKASVFSINKPSSNYANNKELVIKVSKIGWTYTPPPKVMEKVEEPKIDSLCYLPDINKDLNVVESSSSISSERSLDSCSAKSKTSLLSFKKLKINLGFLEKIKSSQFMISPKSSSIKYKKLRSRSTTF